MESLLADPLSVGSLMAQPPLRRLVCTGMESTFLTP